VACAILTIFIVRNMHYGVTRKEMYDYIVSVPDLLAQLNAEIASGKRINTVPEVEIEGNYFDIACVYIKTKDTDSVAYSAGYFTPKWIIDEIKEKNTEYGHITQRLSGDSEKDPIKYFSDSKIKRGKRGVKGDRDNKTPKSVS